MISKYKNLIVKISFVNGMFDEVVEYLLPENYVLASNLASFPIPRLLQWSLQITNVTYKK